MTVLMHEGRPFDCVTAYVDAEDAAQWHTARAAFVAIAGEPRVGRWQETVLGVVFEGGVWLEEVWIEPPVPVPGYHVALLVTGDAMLEDAATLAALPGVAGVDVNFCDGLEPRYASIHGDDIPPRIDWS